MSSSAAQVASTLQSKLHDMSINKSSPFSAQVASTLQSKLDDVCTAAAGPHQIPGIVFVVIDAHGTQKFAHAAGKRGHEIDEPMTLDSVFWIASCTKLITAVACMQLFEKGIVGLDDEAIVEKHLPELKDVKILVKDEQGKFKLEEKKRGITLRMLLSHTAGFSYAFFNNEIRDYSRPVGYDEFSGDIADITQPLVHQPGEAWEYGVNIDWAGILIERVTNKSLDEYFKENIFKPIGISDISLFPDESMKSRLAFMHSRDANGKLAHRDHLVHRPLRATSADAIKSCLNSGGGGAFAKPTEYCKLLSTLLNNGTSPQTGNKILSPETVDHLFANQIPEHPDFGRKGIPAAKPDLTNPIPDMYPAVDAAGKPLPQGWSMAGMLTPTLTGRASTTAWWAGLANLFWWCDREKGVGGMIASQIVPFGDVSVLGTWDALEKEVYKAL